MSTKLNILLTGATGYIGGSVLSRLLKHPNAATFHITALARSSDKADKLKTLGVDTIIGSYTDEDLTYLTEAAANADVVFAIANDIIAPTKAILLGLKQRHASTGVPPILIHTSGSAIVVDDARGMHSEHRSYSDVSDIAALDALPETADHRDVDVAIQAVDKAGIIKAYIITPSTIFGYPSGVVNDLGVQNTHSIQLPYIIQASIARKQGGYFGKGLNSWPAVHVDDTADLYLTVFDVARSDPEGTPHGYYFVENFDYTAAEVASLISEALVELGVATTRETSAFTDEEIEKIFGVQGAAALSTNCYIKADRGRALGWKPKYGKSEFLKSVKDEVAAYLKLAQK